jgi:hypothetical protein
MLSWQHTFGASVALTQVLWHGSKPKPSRKISQGCPRTVQNQKGWHPMEVAETNKTQRPKILRHSTFAKKNSRSSPLCKCWGPDQTIRWRPQAVAGWGAFLAMAGIRLSVCWIHSAWGGKTMVSTTKKTTIPNLQKPSFVGRWACDVPIDYPETVISVHSVPILAG